MLLRQMEEHCREMRSPWLLHRPSKRTFISLPFNTKNEEWKTKMGESRRAGYSEKCHPGSPDQRPNTRGFVCLWLFCVCSFEDYLIDMCYFCLFSGWAACSLQEKIPGNKSTKCLEGARKRRAMKGGRPQRTQWMELHLKVKGYRPESKAGGQGLKRNLRKLTVGRPYGSLEQNKMKQSPNNDLRSLLKVTALVENMSSH